MRMCLTLNVQLKPFQTGPCQLVLSGCDLFQLKSRGDCWKDSGLFYLNGNAKAGSLIYTTSYFQLVDCVEYKEVCADVTCTVQVL